MRKLLLIIGMVCVTAAAVAQTLMGSAPSHVAMGEQFRLTYTVNTQNVSEFPALSPSLLPMLLLMARR